MKPDDDYYSIEMINDLKELLFISNFIKNKKKHKKEIDTLKKMVKHYSNGKFEKYLNEDKIIDD